jgi:hypothetical protein
MKSTRSSRAKLAMALRSYGLIMNKCPYCGANYSDGVVACPIDQTPLKDTHLEQVKNAPSGLTLIALTIFRLLAVPTAIMGCVSIYDLFIATPKHDTTTIVEKHVSFSGGYRTSDHAYQLQVEGHRNSIPVPLWFYDDCSLHDTVELSLSPIFKYPHQISLIRNEVVEAKTTPSGKYIAIFFMAFGPFLPILLFVRSIRDRFGEASSVRYNSGKVSPLPNKVIIVVAYFVLVFACEMVAICLFLSVLFDYDKPK